MDLVTAWHAQDAYVTSSWTKNSTSWSGVACNSQNRVVDMCVSNLNARVGGPVTHGSPLMRAFVPELHIFVPLLFVKMLSAHCLLVRLSTGCPCSNLMRAVPHEALSLPFLTQFTFPHRVYLSSLSLPFLTHCTFSHGLPPPCRAVSSSNLETRGAIIPDTSTHLAPPSPHPSLSWQPL